MDLRGNPLRDVTSIKATPPQTSNDMGNHFVRDYYKQQFLNEAKEKRAHDLNYRRKDNKRPLNKLSSSLLGADSIPKADTQELELDLYHRLHKKKRFRSGLRKKSSGTDSDERLLEQLRKEYILIESSKSYIDERRLEAALAIDNNRNFRAKPETEFWGD